MQGVQGVVLDALFSIVKQLVLWMFCPGCPAPQDDIVPLVMPFVSENIGKKATPEDWRLREAATLAFASILEGPSYGCLASIVREAMGFLLAVSCMRWPGSSSWQ